MDSVSQIALGAAVATAVMGQRAGFRAPLWGAALGTLPDLDVLISMGGPVADFTYHRSFSHSLLVLLCLSPLLAWLIRQCHPQLSEYRRGWLWLVVLVLLTHPLLDAFTVYGTQLFWPLSSHPFGLGSIFIIDPLYTLPLLIGLIAFFWQGPTSSGLRVNGLGLLLSTGYLLWSALAQQSVEQKIDQELTGRVNSQQLLVQPTPFNTLLWRYIAMTDDGYIEGFYSLLDGDQPLQFKRYPSSPALLNELEQHWPVKRLRWFTHGFYSVSLDQQAVLINDLRMGLEPDYVFRFKVAELRSGQVMAAPDQLWPTARRWDRMPALWDRIWHHPDTKFIPGF